MMIEVEMSDELDMLVEWIHSLRARESEARARSPR